MIRLKSIVEFTDNTESSNIDAIPEVLFLGDSYTKSRFSYARKLSDSGIVNGKVVAWPNINIKQLTKLLSRYINDKTSIVSILFGDIIKQNIDLESFNKYLKDLQRITSTVGANLVIVRNPSNLYNGYEEYLTAIDEMDASLFININGQIANSDVQTKIANNWISYVNSTFNMKLDAVKVDDSPAGDDADDVDIDSSEDANYSISNANYSDSIVNQAYDLIIPFEGFTPIPKIDTDGYCRIGHGSSHITKKNGSVINLGKPEPGKSCDETYPYTITIEDAHRDLRRLIPHTFLPVVERYVRMWGGDIKKFNDATVAALVSVAYNYGHVPSKLKAGIAANDAKAIGEALLTNFNSKGENPSRRKREGQYIIDSLDAESNTVSDKKSLRVKLTDLVSKKLNIYSPFGRRKRGPHYGIDYSPMPVGSKIYTATPGTISAAGNIDPDGWGNTVMIDHEDGTTTLYAHLSSIAVNKGDSVEAGTYIGATGGKGGMQGAGNSEGPHLHWEYHPGGYTGKNSARDGASVADNYFKIV